ncbi:MAG: methyltransferase domain-containing protein [Pirellulales bacterium]
MSHNTQRLVFGLGLSNGVVADRLSNRVALVAVSLVLISATHLVAQEKPAKDGLPKATEPTLQEVPPAKKEYMGRVIAPAMGYAHAAWLTRDTREQEEDPLQTLANLGLKPGMVVCDLGCGNGYYTIEMAKRVAPTGKIFAVDIQPEMLHLLELRLEEKEVKNVELVLGGLVDPRMPDDSIDLLLMVDVYHEFSHPVLMLQALRKSLKPEGRIALVEFRAEDRNVPIRPEHKMSKKQILKEYKANGFKLVEEYDKLPWQHLMFFQRDPDWKPKSE